jgi:hypothetical protein
MEVLNACQVQNAHFVLQAAFWQLFTELCGSEAPHCGFEYNYCLSDGEAVDWLHQLLLGDAKPSLFYSDRTNTYSPALGAY